MVDLRGSRPSTRLTRTVTDSDGDTTTTDYDGFDRPVATYPDGLVYDALRR
jgi:YD repeat-containing protein